MQANIYTREQIEAILNKDAGAVVKALKGLYARQTADEQQTQDTVHRNGAGFNFQDAPFLTSVAKALPRWRDHVTPKQLAALRKMLPKYWRQIGEILSADVAPKLVDAPAVYAVPAQVQARPNFGLFA